MSFAMLIVVSSLSFITYLVIVKDIMSIVGFLVCNSFSYTR